VLNQLYHLASVSQPFSACGPLLLKIFVGPTMRCCGETTTIKLKYEKETKYKQHAQFAVYGELEFAH